jgi:hypothetical protein
MGQPRSVVVAGGLDKDLGLVLETAERLAVEDSVSVSLKACSNGVGFFFSRSTRTLRGLGRERGEISLLALLSNFPNR